MTTMKGLDRGAGDLTRRRFLHTSLATVALPLVGTACSTATPMDETSSVPALFVSHGAPDLALDRVKGADFVRLGAALPRPRAIVVVSAHWERSPAAIGTTTPRALMHDYGGFARELRDVTYHAPVASDVAGRVADLLAQRGAPSLERDPARPWDHGVWVPLVHMFPNADVPVVQLSLPSRASGAELVALGRALAPLAHEGVLVLGSGGLVHNLRALDWSGAAPPPSWATEFEAWTRATLAAGDMDALADFRRRAPDLSLAHPSLEHFLPLLVAAGAGHETASAVTFPITGFEYGSLSRTAVQFG
jgi:4,5-DOPA dioxygenase extradiol